MTLKEYRKILWGAKLLIYTDHKNLTFRTFSIKRILRWRLYIDEFDATIQYIEGSKNVLADCFSRLPRMEKPSVGNRELQQKGRLIDFNQIAVPKDDEDILDGESFFLADIEIQDCLLNLPPLAELYNPITITNIVNHQSKDIELMKLIIRDSDHYMQETIHRHEVIVYSKEADRNWKIVIPNSLVKDVMSWYHTILGHAGIEKLVNTIGARFLISKLRERAEEAIRSCPEQCQQYKSPGRGYGHLPPKIVTGAPWDEVALDLWLSRYPKPNRCISDNGGEFIGHEFQSLLAHAGITHVKTTVKNPQSNAVCERMHATMGSMLRVLTNSDDAPTNIKEAEQAVDNALHSCIHALRCAINQAMRTSPGALVFHRDMMIDVPLLVDIDAIRGRKQQLIDNNLIRENKKRIDYNYEVGDRVWIKHYDPKKLEPRLHGPYRITRIYVNGTIDIELKPGVIQRYNIRKVVPYRHSEHAVTPLTNECHFIFEVEEVY